MPAAASLCGYRRKAGIFSRYLLDIAYVCLQHIGETCCFLKLSTRLVYERNG